MTEFLFADCVLIQGYSTAYMEALLVGNRVVPFYLNGKVLLDQIKYPDLPVIKKIEDLDKILSQIMDENYSGEKINPTNHKINLFHFWKLEN